MSFFENSQNQNQGLFGNQQGNQRQNQVKPEIRSLIHGGPAVERTEKACNHQEGQRHCRRRYILQQMQTEREPSALMTENGRQSDRVKQRYRAVENVRQHSEIFQIGKSGGGQCTFATERHNTPCAQRHRCNEYIAQLRDFFSLQCIPSRLMIAAHDRHPDQSQDTR